MGMFCMLGKGQLTSSPASAAGRGKGGSRRTGPARRSNPWPGLRNSSLGSGPLCKMTVSSAGGLHLARALGGERRGVPALRVGGGGGRGPWAHKSLLPSWLDHPSIVLVALGVLKLSLSVNNRVKGDEDPTSSTLPRLCRLCPHLYPAARDSVCALSEPAQRQFLATLARSRRAPAPDLFSSLAAPPPRRSAQAPPRPLV